MASCCMNTTYAVIVEHEVARLKAAGAAASQGSRQPCCSDFGPRPLCFLRLSSKAFLLSLLGFRPQSFLLGCFLTQPLRFQLLQPQPLLLSSLSSRRLPLHLLKSGFILVCFNFFSLFFSSHF